MSDSAPRLLYLVNVPWYFVSHRLQLARAARRAGYDVHIAAAREGGAEALQDEQFPVHFVPLSRSGKSIVTEFAAIRSLYKRLRPDLVHHVTIKPVLLGSVAARLSAVPAVVNALPGLGYVFMAHDPMAAGRRRLILLAYRLALGHRNSRVIFQNGEDMDLFLRRGLVRHADCSLIRGAGVDLEAFQSVPEPPGKPIVLLASRMLKHKGVEEFVAAATRLGRDGVHARFLLAGDPDPANPASISREQLDAWHTSGVVEWLGFQDDMAGLIRRAHIVCLPSYGEGMPKILLEALASARPIVTTDVPGCRDLVADGRCGLRVPVMDSEALADALRRLIQDGGLRKKMGQSGRALAEANFGVERVVAETLAVYRELLPV